jgi:transcription factor IIIB subunit 2
VFLLPKCCCEQTKDEDSEANEKGDMGFDGEYAHDTGDGETFEGDYADYNKDGYADGGGAEPDNDFEELDFEEFDF